MPQARILVNTVAGSNDDLPINTSVALANDNVGGETTYLWAIVSQPAGAADALTSTTASASSFTPLKEGSYLLRLTVNGSLIDTVIVAVRHLKTRVRIPAAGETDEVDASGGWSLAADIILDLAEDTYSDPGRAVGLAGAGLTVGAVVHMTTTGIIKSGLPGQEVLPTWSVATAATSAACRGTLALVLGKVGGGAISAADLINLRTGGLAQGLSIGGAPAVGAEVYLDDAGALNTTPGTVRRLLGVIVSGAGPYTVDWNGGAPDTGAFVPQTRTLTGTTPIAIDGAYTAQPLSANRTLSLAVVGQTRGDLLFYGASGWTRLPASTGGYLLQTNGTSSDPSWVAPAGGISSITIATTAPLTGGATGTSFTLALSTGAGLNVSGGALVVVFGTTAGTAAQGNDARIVGAVQSTRQVLTNAPLGGGGALSADLTLTWGFGSEAHGDVAFRGASTWERLAANTAGKFLRTNGVGADPSWETPAAYTLPFFLVGPAGSGPGGSNPPYATITAALTAAPALCAIAIMDGEYVEDLTLTKSQRLIAWGRRGGSSATGGLVQITGTVTINPDANGRRPAVQGIRVAPAASGNGIRITGANSCEVDLSDTEALAPAGDSGVLCDSTHASTKVYAQRLRAESALGRGYQVSGASHAHVLDMPVLSGLNTALEVGAGATVSIHAAPRINGKLIANGGLIAARYCYQAALAAAPFRVGGGGTLVAEFHRVDSTSTGDLVEYTGAGAAGFVYSNLSILGTVKRSFAAGITPVPLSSVWGHLEQTMTVTGNVDESTDILFLSGAGPKVEATMPDPTRRLGRPIYVKNKGSAAHDLVAFAGTTLEGATSVSLASGQAYTFWPAYGTTDYKVLGEYDPAGGGGGSTAVSFVYLSAKLLTLPNSTTTELAGGREWTPAEHDYSGARTVKFRAVLAAQSVANAVRVRLWSITDSAYVADLDGAGNNYLQTTSLTGAVLLSPDLRTGHANFTVGTSGRVYEVHVQSTSTATQALLYEAELAIGS